MTATAIRTRKIQHGLYVTLDGRFRIERVLENVDQYAVVGWHLFDTSESDPYMGTYYTKADALRGLAGWLTEQS